MDEHQ